MEEYDEGFLTPWKHFWNDLEPCLKEYAKHPIAYNKNLLAGGSAKPFFGTIFTIYESMAVGVAYSFLTEKNHAYATLPWAITRMAQNYYYEHKSEKT